MFHQEASVEAIKMLCPMYVVIYLDQLLSDISIVIGVDHDFFVFNIQG